MKKFFLLITIYFLFWEKIYTQTATLQVAAPVDVYALGLDYATIKVDNPTTNMIYIHDFFSNMEILLPNGQWLELDKRQYTFHISPRPIRNNRPFTYTKKIALTTLLKEDSIFGVQLLKGGGTISLRIGCYVDTIKSYSNIVPVNILPLNNEDLQIWNYCKAEGIDINIFTSTLWITEYKYIKIYQNILQRFPNSTFATIADFALTHNRLAKPYLTKTEKEVIKQKITTFLDSPFPLIRQRAKEILEVTFAEEE
jgi:hypothetical protein